MHRWMHASVALIPTEMPLPELERRQKSAMASSKTVLIVMNEDERGAEVSTSDSSG